ncbi:MAG: coenzyme F420-0:L-glutamate ligase [Candidatus Sericytochromatia bacterium]|nr:coenzyme F420-0:L-glutamate ligase [Candidatus Sericytochromatia bacterium]
MDGLLTSLGGAVGALLLGTAAFEGLYRLRDTRTIELMVRRRGAWEELPAPAGERRFRVAVPFHNHNLAYEQTLVDVRPSVRLLKREAAAAWAVDASVSVHALTDEGRADGYWAACLLGPGESCEMDVRVTLRGEPEALSLLHAVVVQVAYDTYGRVDLQTFQTDWVLPLATPKPLPPALQGKGVAIQCVPTPLLTDADDIVEVIDTATRSFRQPGDVVAVAESVVAITQGRYFRPTAVRPGFWAKRLCFFVPSKGSLSSRHGFQLAMNDVGAARMVAAFFLGALGKLLGRKGVMYEVAGQPAELIDDITGTMPPFDKYIVAGPDQPDQVVARIKARTGMEAAIVDANDLKRAMVLAVTPGVQASQVSTWLLDNPFGNAAEQTPIVVLRPHAAGAHDALENAHVPSRSLS